MPARHDVLPHGGDRRQHDARQSVGKLGQQRRACAGLRRAFDRSVAFFTRTQQRDAIVSFAEIVEKVGEAAFGRVGRGNDNEERSAQRALQRGEHCRSRRRDRFVQRADSRLTPAQTAQRAQALDRGLPGTVRFGQRQRAARQRVRELRAYRGSRRSYGPLIITGRAKKRRRRRGNSVTSGRIASRPSADLRRRPAAERLRRVRSAAATSARAERRRGRRGIAAPSPRARAAKDRTTGRGSVSAPTRPDPATPIRRAARARNRRMPARDECGARSRGHRQRQRWAERRKDRLQRGLRRVVAARRELRRDAGKERNGEDERRSPARRRRRCGRAGQAARVRPQRLRPGA